eukprot:2709340-Rhodomonas_salina.1
MCELRLPMVAVPARAVGRRKLRGQRSHVSSEKACAPAAASSAGEQAERVVARHARRVQMTLTVLSQPSERGA